MLERECGIERARFLAGCIGLLLLVSPASAAQTCNFLLQNPKIHPGDVVILHKASGAVFSDPIAFRGASRRVRLGYVAPARDYPSGALILKIRYQPIPGNAAAHSPIRLSRESYKSPCTDVKVPQYGNSADPNTYIDYHQYGFRDPEPNQLLNLDAFHADIGMRPNRGCANTADRDIRGQFLFAETLAGRQVAGFLPTFFRQGQKLAPSFEVGQTIAAPAEYADFIGLQSIIVPYRKPVGSSACFAFDVPAAGNVARTDVMIIDADDALAPWSGGDPQKTRVIYWNAR
jgi:hypothetical protein